LPGSSGTPRQVACSPYRFRASRSVWPARSPSMLRSTPRVVNVWLVDNMRSLGSVATKPQNACGNSKRNGPNRRSTRRPGPVGWSYHNQNAITDGGDSISTRQRSFLGRCGAMGTNRRFPPPWSIEESCFVVNRHHLPPCGQNGSYEQLHITRPSYCS
jgi:hypothetical protein